MADKKHVSEEYHSNMSMLTMVAVVAIVAIIVMGAVVKFNVDKDGTGKGAVQDAAPTPEASKQGAIVGQAGATLADSNLPYTVGNPPPLASCDRKDQAFFDQYNRDVEFDFTIGCYELAEDIRFDHQIIVKGGGEGTYFNCNNHQITYKTDDGKSTVGMIVQGSNVVKNCRVAQRHTGFVVEGGTVQNGAALENLNNGFVVNGGTVRNSEASSQFYGPYHEGVSGFAISAGRIENSRAHDNSGNGFYITGGTVVNNVAANNAKNGFEISSAASTEVRNNEASNNDFGFYMVHSCRPVVKLNSAHDNRYGFYLGDVCCGIPDADSVSDNTAANNAESGFDLSCATMRNSISTGNKDGFTVWASNVYDLRATGNTQYGVRGGGGTINNVYAANNNIGIRIGASDTWTTSGTGLYAENNNARGVILLGGPYSPTSVTGITSINNCQNHDPTCYGVELSGSSTAHNVKSNYNQNNIFVDHDAQLLDGTETCYSTYETGFIQGTARGDYKASKHFSGTGDYTQVRYLSCTGGSSPVVFKGGASPLFVKNGASGRN